jgi:3-isopropylmalate/(R)-2-methylmalate dehydratase small subunit
MQTVFRGRSWVFGDSIDTDMITPGKYLAIIEPKGLAEHLLEGKDPDFPKKVKPGDILVVGQNFGCGSSREHAVAAMKGVPIACVVGESFARIFYRNALNLGLPAVVCAEAKRIRDGDLLRVSFEQGRIANLTVGETLQCEPIPEHLLQMVRDGGLLAHLEKRLGGKR